MNFSVLKLATIAPIVLLAACGEEPAPAPAPVETAAAAEPEAPSIPPPDGTFFKEAWAKTCPNAKPVIKAVVAMQDHLGALQDVVVASGILGDYLAWGTWGHEASDVSHEVAPGDAPGVQAYLAVQEAELTQLLESFPQAWQQLEGLEFRRMLAETVAEL